MSDAPRFWYVDLVCVVVHAGLTAYVVLFEVAPVLRALVVVPTVVLLPGYALVAALYPERMPRENVEWQAFDPEQRGAHADAPVSYGLSRVDRLALAIPVSVVIVPLLALVVDISPSPLRAGPLLAAVCGPMVLLAVVAFARRLRLPAPKRFTPFGPVPVSQELDSGGSRPLVGWSSATAEDWLIRGAVAVSLIAFAGSVAFAATAPPPAGDRFTEAYLVAENDDGNLTTAAVPRELTAGASTELAVGLRNHEYERAEYQVVVQIARSDDGTRRTVEELDRFAATLEHGESVERRHEIRPSESGADLRLTYLVFRGGVPLEPAPANAYRVLGVDVRVQPPQEESAVVAGNDGPDGR
ncbi:hypothetical protein BRD02_07270 [Halobacteriales archaeon QS_8_69_73]|nr:MAG: hypothetical protein BRD02_07270 [Halobacteriales archaeon QS_8_69_73]